MPNHDTITAYLSSHLSGTDVAPMLRELLRQCKVEDSLRTIANAASNGSESERPSQLALVVRFLLEDESAAHTRDRTLTADDLAAACEMAASIVSSPDSAFGAPVSDSAWSMAHRIAYQQFPDQEESRYVPRSLAIYRQIAPTLVENGGFDFEQSYQQAYGLTIDDAWQIGYALTRWCLSNPGIAFSPSTLQQQLELEHIDQGKYRKFLATQSCDYDVYRSMLSTPTEGQPHFEPYNLNPFRKYPILTLPGGNHLLPIPGYLLRRITHGLYYDLIELDRPGYISLIGRTFREYTGRLLSELTSDSLSQLEDGLWVVSNDDTAVLIECITRPFGALSRSTGDRTHLHADLARRAGVVDSVKRLQDIQNSAADGSTSHAVLRGKSVLGVVVALEDFYLANGPFIRSIVDAELGNQKRAAMGPGIQLTHVGGLESACARAIASNGSLAALIARKVNQPEYCGLEMDAFARHEALIGNFGDGKRLSPKILTRAAAAFLQSD
ncbi:MAG: hypothetical protein IIC24_08090 [Chloroflexi bacterium]|nr:hypothetical protein [Chloroflexota bacterium]